MIFLGIVLAILFTVSPINENAGPDEGKTDGLRVLGAFLAGAFLSGAAGWLGMSVATDGNVRTSVACVKGSLNDGLVTAFTAGSVMGFTVVGLGLAGLSLMYWVQTLNRNSVIEYKVNGVVMYQEPEAPLVMEILAGFGVGASSIALFARVAGGIYTKAADVGADLVGKVQFRKDFWTDPAVIAARFAPYRLVLVFFSSRRNSSSHVMISAILDLNRHAGITSRAWHYV